MWRNCFRIFEDSETSFKELFSYIGKPSKRRSHGVWIASSTSSMRPIDRVACFKIVATRCAVADALLEYWSWLSHWTCTSTWIYRFVISAFSCCGSKVIDAICFDGVTDSVAQTITLTILALFLSSGLNTVSGAPSYGLRAAVSTANNMDRWLQPCGNPVAMQFKRMPQRHSVHRTLKRVRTQLRVAQNHFRMHLKDVQEIYSKVNARRDVIRPDRDS